ncbi:MAG: glutamine--fructose-6-phosphate transaminase (isomerizing) [Bacteriovoracaceae bacterium]|nr:glutamine--fructose-6-phosphate transaminase (isomerizing) [Bacteriovoracaceae bacterium]
MCGIVGYTGRGDAIAPVIEGLTRLEYRGYDSAGISLLNSQKELIVFKKEGKLGNLKEVLAQYDLKSHQAIGHTRWATHGVVNDINAHPHANKDFSVVHNGIIENAHHLKEQLIKEGHKFQSETDSEVFLLLVTKFYRQTKDVKQSILNSFALVKGHSAFVVMSFHDRNIYGLRSGAPLVCGERKNKTGEAELYLSSDPYALVGHVDTIYFPENRVLSVLNRELDKIEFFDVDTGKETLKYKKEARLQDLEVSTKGEFEHFMLKEIFEQPMLIKKLQQYACEEGASSFTDFAIENKTFDFFHVVACGSAWHAGLVLKEYLEKLTKKRVNVELASEFRYRNPILGKKDLAIFISQSGETADTLASAQLCKDFNIETLAIVNVKGSSLFRLCDHQILTNAGQEIGVASTKAFTLQVLTGFILAKIMSGEKLVRESSMWREFQALEQSVSNILVRRSEIRKMAERFFQHQGFIFTGRGAYVAMALEGALKIKEIAYVHAEGYAAGELKHGPIALIDERMVNVALIPNDLFDKNFSNAQEIRARKGTMLVISSEENRSTCETISDEFFAIQDLENCPHLAPLAFNVVLQLFSYEVAKLKGTDIDKPRNLAKSVTVE